MKTPELVNLWFEENTDEILRGDGEWPTSFWKHFDLKTDEEKSQIWTALQGQTLSDIQKAKLEDDIHFGTLGEDLFEEQRRTHTVGYQMHCAKYGIRTCHSWTLAMASQAGTNPKKTSCAIL